MFRIRALKCLFTSALFLAWLVVPSARAADHNPLLPRPQEVRYGNGSLRLQGLSIRIASDASAEDRFAAEQLATALSSRSGTSIDITRARVRLRLFVCGVGIVFRGKSGQCQQGVQSADGLS